MPKGTRIMWSRESGATHADRYLCAALDQSNVGSSDRAYEGSQLRYLRRRRERANNFSIRRELKSNVESNATQREGRN